MNYKFLIIFLLFGHIQFNAQNRTDTIVAIDSLEFYSNQIKFDTIWEKSNVIKNNGVIKVPLNNKIVEFKDNTNVEYFFEYSVIGEKNRGKWLLIKGENYNKDYYYIINQKFNKIDTLIGFPVIFNNKIVCVEGVYTDWSEYIEIWNIKNNDIKLYKKFSLKRMFDIYLNEIYLKKNVLYVKDIKSKYYKININKI